MCGRWSRRWRKHAAASNASASSCRACIRQTIGATSPSGFVSGSIWHDSGQCERALPLYREAFATVERTYGATNSNTADVEAKLGSCLHALGQDTEAVTHLERVLEIRGGVGSAPNVVAEAAFQLAEVLAGRGARERDRAIALAERALASWREDGVTERAQAAEEWLARQRSPKVERTGRNRAKKVAELGPGSTRRLVHHPGH
jgi:tetratricopeptide (TPR) repeat protein